MIQRLTMLNILTALTHSKGAITVCRKSSKIIGLLGDKQTQQPHYVSLNSTGVRLAIYRKDHRFL